MIGFDFIHWLRTVDCKCETQGDAAGQCVPCQAADEIERLHAAIKCALDAVSADYPRSAEDILRTTIGGEPTKAMKLMAMATLENLLVQTPSQDARRALGIALDCIRARPSLDLTVAQAHRACHAAEHDPQNGKLHGYCMVCGVPWPCDTAKYFLRDLPK